MHFSTRSELHAVAMYRLFQIVSFTRVAAIPKSLQCLHPMSTQHLQAYGNSLIQDREIYLDFTNDSLFCSVLSSSRFLNVPEQIQLTNARLYDTNLCGTVLVLV